MKILEIILLVGLMSLSFSDDGKDQSSCNFSKVDSTLNKVYNHVLAEYKSDTLFIHRLKDAQRAWVKFRDAHLEARFPTRNKNKPNFEYGSIYPDCACDVLSMLTNERIQQLQEWLNGTVEGDGCSGSYKVK